MQRISTSTAVSIKPAPRSGGAPGYFTDGDAASGQPGTVINQDFLNGVQETIIHPIELSGQVLDRNDDTQLSAAIRALGFIAPFDAEFAKKIGGYPKSAIIADAKSDNLYWRSTASGNMTTPGHSGAAWVSLFAGLTPTPTATSGNQALAVSSLYTQGEDGTLWVSTFDKGGASVLRRLVTLDQFELLNYGTGSGYRITPDGFIEQWGMYTTNSDGMTIVYFPVNFPNKCASVVVSEARAGGSWLSNQPTWHGVYDVPPTNGFTVLTRGFADNMPGRAVTATGYYQAIGY